MTNLMDNLFIKIGFDNRDIKRSSKRGVFYVGIVFMLGMTTAFIIMIFLG